MAFTKTSDSIIIKATLTEKGKKLLSRGKFKIAKFAFGDDEVDYRLYNAEFRDDLDYTPGLTKTFQFEALKDINKNIQFGLNSYDAGVLYLSNDELEFIEPYLHAYVDYLPVLKINNLLSYSPTKRNDRYYVSVNDETTKIINDGISNFKFLQTNNLDITKLVVESGIDNSPSGPDKLVPTLLNRNHMILKKFLLDKDFLILGDNRFVSSVAGIKKTSRFENFASGEAIINFHTAQESVAISLESEFEYFATYPIPTIPNLIATHGLSISVSDETPKVYSTLNGPRGSVAAINVLVDDQLKVNSTGVRDDRFVQFGTLDNITFSELPTSKFDYIDTTIYVMGVTTNSRVQIPLRIIRYAGT
jgi:hypothetical protein